MSWDKEGFAQKLESQHEFPGLFIFKFIVPVDAVEKVEALWSKGGITKKASSNGNYISVTINAEVEDSAEVIRVYEEASRIEGCIAL